MDWTDAPQRLGLPADEIHVWRTDVAIASSRLQTFFATMSSTETTRAERCYFNGDHDRFVTSRGILRDILHRYLNLEPQDVCIQCNEYGKLRLGTDLAPHSIRFNVSHADNLSVYAITRDQEIGIDIERVRADFVDFGIAERFFSRAEVAALRSLPSKQRTQAFFNCWVRKAAYVKAVGRGVSTSMDSFDVALVPGQPAAVLRSMDATTSCWSLFEVIPRLGYAGAVAVEGNPVLSKLWTWTQ